MASRNRETLRNYFRDGKLPSEHHFGDLVDSMLNMVDEGFRKSAEHGVEISTPAGHDALISFYRDRSPNSPKTTISFGGEAEHHEQILFNVGASRADADADRRERMPVLTLDVTSGGDAQEGTASVVQRVGINQRNPGAELDVRGVIRSEGRMGAPATQSADSLLADGIWHDITPPMRGCQAFEVMAGVGQEHSGKFALLHAVALNTFNPAGGLIRQFVDRFFSRKRIRRTSAYYSRRCDQIELRWHGGSGRDGDYRLQIRSRCAYGNGKDVRIQCYLTRLWFDPRMKNCVVGRSAEG